MKRMGLVLTVMSFILLVGASCGKSPDNTVDNSTSPTNSSAPNNNGNALLDNQILPETSPVQPGKTVVVQYTGSGFSPSSVTINVGDSVLFRNTGQTAAMWPAANPHPLHTSVPGFDAKRPLDTGGEYSFTFTKAGTVTYHNHLNAGQVGTIVVK